MSHTFVAYIDESGDDGLRKLRDRNHGGSSRWLALSCCVVRRANDLQLISVRNSILSEIQRTKTRHLHFADLNHHQRLAACRILAQAPVRLINVLSNKSTVPQLHAFRTDKSKLYWYLGRYLIERISWLCDDAAVEEPKRVKIVFSNRSGLSYEEFREYMTVLKTQCDTQIRWHVIDIDAIESRPHTQLAGLQLADCGASAFYAAVEPTRYGDYEPRYAEMLKPVTYRRRRNFLSYGVKIVPNVSVLNQHQQRLLDIFRE